VDWRKWRTRIGHSNGLEIPNLSRHDYKEKISSSGFQIWEGKDNTADDEEKNSLADKRCGTILFYLTRACDNKDKNSLTVSLLLSLRLEP